MPAPVQRVVDSALGLGAQALRMAHTRLEILVNDFEREKEALANQLMLAVACGACAAMGAFALVLWIALAFEPHIRFILLGLLTLAFAVAAVVLGMVVRRNARRRDRLFARLIDTLKRDSESLEPGTTRPAP
jgi:uncharacterized membrane protein YqjE